jgi:plastocyanin
MKKFLVLAGSILLIGGGCGATVKTGSVVEVETAIPTATAPAPEPPKPSAAPTPVVKDVVMKIGGDAEEQAVTPAPPKDVIVEITAGGSFSPTIVTVKKGTKVTWKNLGDAPVWPAVNPHPVHTEYQGFDARTDLRKGETYSFTFDKVGSWNYHNHLNPGTTGTVIVTE